MPDIPVGAEQPGLVPAASPPHASGDTCVYVVGMHRSGTSATCGVLCHLGLGAPREGDRLRNHKTNERGFWESKSLNRFDERLLVHLGGRWLAPPALEPGWENDPALAAMKVEAASLFAAAFGPRPIAWKDPRSSIVLPFWNSVLKPPHAAVLVFRDAYEVASSIQSRNRLRITHGFAMWERYIRSSVANLEGMPTFVMSYASLLESPEQRCEELITFLDEVSVTVDRSLTANAVGFLDDELRHERKPQSARSAVPESARELQEAIESLQGPHHPFKAPDIGVESPWVEDTLSISLELDNLKKRHAEMYASRPMRWARGLQPPRQPAPATALTTTPSHRR